MALFPLSVRRQRRLSRGLQLVIAGVLVVGVARRNLSVVVNAAMALAVTFLPALLERDSDISLGAGVTLWVTLAVSLHSLGMLGLYTAIPWWDSLTHTLSASVVAGVGYATVRAIDEHTRAVYFPPPFLSVFVLVVTLAFGVFWEVLEFSVRGVTDLLGLQAVLVQYSLEDTLTDLVFDAVGAALVALFGTHRLSATVDSLVGRLEQRRGR
ncbi:hypothetical protein [Haloprofundus sp. MHR1]|uniref:hypothetical protein n=1 Tax=Haloprofundus sp. MHR1 TaxID=2572921 RepID=UPI0010BE9028|nr:hypothetical protein [Haloprofundus sp. MHR1]QCJ45770.1 hypothetical protein FCF25_00940 [Haloprofundus sp. MHR1]